MKAKLTGLLIGVVILSLAPRAMAVAYASGVSKVGDDVSFILNQNAFSVEAILDGGAQTLNLATTAGQLSFNMAGYSSYQIRVKSNPSSGWGQFIADGFDRNFYVPVGVSVNKMASSPDFGKVYVSEATGGPTAAGRTTTEGIWMLRADGSSIAKGVAAGVTWGAGSGPWKSTIGQDGHLYVTDLSNDLAYEFDGNVAAGTQLITAGNRTANQWVGGIAVEGTQAAGNRKIYLADVNYYSGAPGRKGLIRYDLGGNATATAGDTGTQVIGPSYFTYYPYDVALDSQGDFYMCQFRSDPTQAPAISKFDGSLAPPINTALWETVKTAPYNGAYGIDINEQAGYVAYGNYYDGWVRIFDTDDGSYVGGFDAGTRVRDLAFDAAGNIVTVDNSIEYARFWSPGVDDGMRWETIFGSDGTFSVVMVPEPTTLSLLALGSLALLLRRRR